MSLSYQVDNYLEVEKSWPIGGRHILGSYSQDWIILYQAFNNDIVDWAIKHQSFLGGCPKYSLTRMTWFKTNFLWMMYRSGWASKPNQERILAIFVKLDGFEKILRNASEKEPGSSVRLQWDPDHDPKGNKNPNGRRAIQLGLRGEILEKFHKNSWIVKIEDITDFVKSQSKFVDSNNFEKLLVPAEKVYIPKDESICDIIKYDQVL